MAFLSGVGCSHLPLLSCSAVFGLLSTTRHFHTQIQAVIYFMYVKFWGMVPSLEQVNCCADCTRVLTPSCIHYKQSVCVYTYMRRLLDGQQHKTVMPGVLKPKLWPYFGPPRAVRCEKRGRTPPCCENRKAEVKWTNTASFMGNSSARFGGVCDALVFAILIPQKAAICWGASNQSQHFRQGH